MEIFYEGEENPMREMKITVILLLILLLIVGCSTQNAEFALNNEIKEATEITSQENDDYYDRLDFSDQTEATFATQNLIAAPETLELWNDDHTKVVWSQEAYAFLEDYEEAPDSVNPSLWQNTKNNHAYGLFMVKEGIYQVRGYDISNLTVVATDNGWIVFDPLISTECSKAAMQLINDNLGAKPIVAVIYSHSHVDHYGGVEGLIDVDDVADSNLPIEEQLASGKVVVLAPEGFTQHAISENVYAGTAMSRRAGYQYGVYLEPGVTGTLAIGIGMGQSIGTVSFIPPTYEITETGETLLIDGKTLEFQMTPGTEAPVEMNTFFPDYKALWIAENCTGTLHNLYTLRGAEVRDGNAWAKYITEAWVRYGANTDVVFQSHNWPHWGNDIIKTYMENTATVYKYINDQTLTYINQGYTSDEISNMIKLPEVLDKIWYTRQYYGTVAHDAKAVYQKYMGWYDANPVNLNPLSPTDSAKKWVEYLGDTDEVLTKAKEDFAKGEYQWVAEVTNVIVFAEPDNLDARYLCADALEQLGYQAESGTWRNAYLSGAYELRNGTVSDESLKASGSTGTLMSMDSEMILDYMSIRLDGDKAGDMDYTVNLNLVDTGEIYTLRIYGGVILHYAGISAPTPDLTITTEKNALFYLLSGDQEGVINSMQMVGNTDILKELAVNMVNFNQTYFFNIVEP
ncbi:alkyl sulfatase dimerization domain-containing protein [Eubacteriaceae bacterium ES2]|nr:alkyl sulfatase dimerization domain-containing protein [Eubacteriaceae bacterium ES2]